MDFVFSSMPMDIVYCCPKYSRITFFFVFNESYSDIFYHNQRKVPKCINNDDDDLVIQVTWWVYQPFLIYNSFTSTLYFKL